MIDETTLRSSEKKVLRNRFYAAKNRAMTNGTPFYWESFQDWLTDFCELAPEDFNSEDYRVSYDNNAPEGYAPQTIRVAPSRKRRQENKRRALLAAEGIEGAKGSEDTAPAHTPSPALADADDMQRMLFSVELTLRLRAFKNNQTFEELVAEAAAAAGIDLKETLIKSLPPKGLDC